VNKPIIEVKNLSKRYRLGSIGVGSFIEDLRWLGTKIGLPCKPPDPSKEFLALDDISFSVEEGEVLGIIGQNGAGKSTLLKILSRITEPTSGHAILRGRISSLLEVGTGFHGEMTGLENIYLNGSLHGLTKKEIDQKLESIIEFSQIGNFIDTPVKRYSSGMYVRLAFAVAIHLEPEILIIDEVLAVGDAGFQIKCTEKINSIRESGRTVLFVSHNMDLIESLCNRCLLLQDSRIKMDDETSNVLSIYRETPSNPKVSLQDTHRLYDTDQITFSTAFLATDSGRQKNVFQIGEPIVISIQCESKENLSKVVFSIKITERKFGTVAYSSSIDDVVEFYKIEQGNYWVEVNISSAFLPGLFSITLNAADDSGKSLCCIENALSFEITRRGFGGRTDYLWTESCAPCYLNTSWNLVSANEHHEK